METLRGTLVLWFLSGLLAIVPAQMNFFSASGDVAFDNPVSSACSSALNSTLECDSRWTNYPNNDFAGPFNTTELDGFCSPICTLSLISYRSSILDSCKNEQPFQDIPASFVSDRMIAYQNRTCLREKPDGDYCNGKQVFCSFVYSRIHHRNSNRRYQPAQNMVLSSFFIVLFWD